MARPTSVQDPAHGSSSEACWDRHRDGHDHEQEVRALGSPNLDWSALVGHLNVQSLSGRPPEPFDVGGVKPDDQRWAIPIGAKHVRRTNPPARIQGTQRRLALEVQDEGNGRNDVGTGLIHRLQSRSPLDAEHVTAFAQSHGIVRE